MKKNKIPIIICVILLCVGLLIGATIGILNKKETNTEVEDDYEWQELIPIEEAINSGWFVIDNKQEKIYNKDVLDRFIENTNMNAIKRVPDKIRIATYGIDGELSTIYDLEYKIYDETYINEEQKEVNKTGYILTTDPSRVTYENRMSYQEQIEAHKITTNEDIPGELYGITLIKEPQHNVNIISLSLYSEIMYADSEKEPYKDIEITTFLTNFDIVNN